MHTDKSLEDIAGRNKVCHRAHRGHREEKGPYNFLNELFSVYSVTSVAKSIIASDENLRLLEFNFSVRKAE
jgi:hypothetical protein